MVSRNLKQPSARVSALAGSTLHDDSASKIARRLAASVVAQSHTRKQTGAEMEGVAARVLASPKYAADTKTLAASVVAQANKER